MKIKRVVGPLGPVSKFPRLTEKDVLEYERTRNTIVTALEKMGGYEPAVDGHYVDEIARTAIYARKVEVFLDADTATVDTYSSVAYSKLKFSKIIENAIYQLALNRRDRLGDQTEGSLKKKMKEEFLKVMNLREQRT